MEFNDIKHAELTFARIGKACYVTVFRGHEIGVMLGDFPPEHLYSIFIDQQHVHSSDNLPAKWKLDDDAMDVEIR